MNKIVIFSGAHIDDSIKLIDSITESQDIELIYMSVYDNFYLNQGEDEDTLNRLTKISKALHFKLTMIRTNDMKKSLYSIMSTNCDNIYCPKYNNRGSLNTIQSIQNRLEIENKGSGIEVHSF